MPFLAAAPTWKPIDLVLGGLWAMAAGALTWSIARSAMQITYVTLADGRRRERRLPMLFRVLLPFTASFPFLEGERYRKARGQITQRLTMAGYDTLLRAREVQALKLLMPLIPGVLLCVLMHFAFQAIPGGFGEALFTRRGYFFVSALLLAYVYPMAWVNKMVAFRHRSIQRALPFVLDLLTLSVEAGLDFMTALRRIVEQRRVDELGEEIIQVFREVQVGKTRKEALRAMAERINHPDIRSVVSALVQADELGVGIATVLRIQSDQIRTRRFQRAEKLANEAPVKMLFPLVCFIFPAVFIVLLGPIFIQMMRQTL